MLSSRVKICFRAKAHLVFHWCLYNKEKYGPLRLELSRQHPGYEIIQFDVIMDVLGGWSKELEIEMRNIFGTRERDCLMQNADSCFELHS